jgi:F0F1-type ATP synthase membrane subunit c/vacuolar-type H+-ATPase subunit K
MTAATAPRKVLRISQPVLAAYASVLAVIIGGAIGVGIAGVASAAGVAAQSQKLHLALPETPAP